MSLNRWPQTTVPTFKITSSQCLKKVRTGEQICLVRLVPFLIIEYFLSYPLDVMPFKILINVINYLEERMKVSWPLSSREALVHFFEFDYFQDDLVVVLLNTVGM